MSERLWQMLFGWQISSDFNVAATGDSEPEIEVVWSWEMIPDSRFGLSGLCIVSGFALSGLCFASGFGFSGLSRGQKRSWEVGADWLDADSELKINRQKLIEEAKFLIWLLNHHFIKEHFAQNQTWFLVFTVFSSGLSKLGNKMSKLNPILP